MFFLHSPLNLKWFECVSSWNAHITSDTVLQAYEFWFFSFHPLILFSTLSRTCTSLRSICRSHYAELHAPESLVIFLRMPRTVGTANGKGYTITDGSTETPIIYWPWIFQLSMKTIRSCIWRRWQSRAGNRRRWWMAATISCLLSLLAVADDSQTNDDLLSF